MVILIFISLVLVGMTLFSGYKMFIEPDQLLVAEKEILSDKIPESLDGLRILHLADFHFDKDNGGHLIHFFDQLIDRNLDLIFLTGDFIETLDGLNNLDEFLKKMLEFNPKYGIYACLGNHDYFHFSRKDFVLVRFVVNEQNDISKLKEKLQENQIQVLLNEHKELKVNGVTLNIVGVDEYVSGRSSLSAALDGISNDYTILLSHAPDVVFHLEPYKVDLVLSGHTHGGQIKLPFLGSVIKRTKLSRNQSSGLFRYNGTNVHTTQGLGASPKAMVRFLCSPEAAILTLRNKKTHLLDFQYN